MIKILNVGIGLGGCRFTQALSASDLCVKSYFLNISADELNQFKEEKNAKLIRVGSGDGAGKDRAVAADHFANNFDKTRLINDIITDATAGSASVINVSFSMGGGTGSGIGPKLTQSLRDAIDESGKSNNLIVHGIALIPWLAREGAVDLGNAVMALEEIYADLEEGGGRYSFLNNIQIDTPGDNDEDQYQYINKYGASVYLDYLRGTTQPASSGGVLDLADRRMALALPGLHAYSELKNQGIVSHGWIGPIADSKVLLIDADIPDIDRDIYDDKDGELNALSCIQSKRGYNATETGILGIHGFSGADEILADVRSRYDAKVVEMNKVAVKTSRNALRNMDSVSTFKLGGQPKKKTT